jgi:hypothetical protein
MKPRLWLALLCWLGSHIATAAEVLHHDIKFKDKHYVLSIEMRVTGTMEQVYSILTDFNHFNTLNSSIKKSQLLFSNHNVATVEVTAEGCVLLFCKTIKQVQVVTELGNGKIDAITDPDESDMAFGETHWQLTAEGKSTNVKYSSDYVPKFWVPPVIGPAILKSRLQEEAQKTIHGIEARIKAGQPHGK